MSIEKHQQLRNRSKAFALRVLRMSQALPRTREANVLAQQILRSGTSMAANYRAAGRARSKAEFVSKMGIVVEEADETVFWLELLKPIKLAQIFAEANELLGHLFGISQHGPVMKPITRSPDHPITRSAIRYA